MALHLTRRVGESIRLTIDGTEVWIGVQQASGYGHVGRTTLMITAPRSVAVEREEIAGVSAPIMPIPPERRS